MSNHARPARIVLVGFEGDDGRIMLGLLRHIRSTLCFVKNLHQLLLLSPGHDFDLLLLNAAHGDPQTEETLEQARELFPFLPMILIVDEGGEIKCERLRRAGAWKVWLRSSLAPTLLRETMSELLNRKADSVALRQERMMMQTLNALRHDHVVVEPMPDDDAMKPLRESLPFRFVELTKSYSNLLELALAVPGSPRRLTGYSVAHKIRVLASDLAHLNAGVRDVLDLHDEALASRGVLNAREHTEGQRVLIELLTDLVAHYKRSAYLVA